MPCAKVTTSHGISCLCNTKYCDTVPPLPSNLGWNMVNERKFETTKRYHEVVSSIAVLIGFVARTYSGNSGMSSSQSRAGTNFILDKAYQMHSICNIKNV